MRVFMMHQLTLIQRRNEPQFVWQLLRLHSVQRHINYLQEAVAHVCVFSAVCWEDQLGLLLGHRLLKP